MNSPLPPDPYHALGVSKDANSNAIRLAHRKLVLTCHPDKVTDEKAKALKTEQFQQVQQAYEILSDETRRKRYDEKVKLAELRAELMSEKKFSSHAFSSRTQEYPSRPTATTSYETRENAIYETREPKQEKATRYHSPNEDYISPHYDHLHSVPRKPSDKSEHRPSRRQSGPAPEESRRSRGRDYDEYDTNILRERENNRKMREQAAHAERRKKRDKDRRQDYQAKHQFTRVEVASESDSEYEARREPRRYEPEPKRKYENTRYKMKAPNLPDSESDHDLETKSMLKAMDHIQKKETRPAIYRYVTKERPAQSGFVPPPPPPPPPPPAPSQRYRDEIVDTPRRSAARSRSSRDESRPKISREDRRPSVIDIPDPRRPSLPTHTSEPAHIRVPPSADRHGLPRSATMETRSKSTKMPGVVRATTTPLASMFSTRYSSDSDRVRSTKTKADIYDSPGSRSSSRSPSPEYQKPIKYRVSHNSSDDRGHARVVSLDPERSSRSTREPSPHAKRPSISTRASSSARVASSRSNSYAPDHVSVPVRPYTGRSETFHESHRSPLTSSGRSKTLFGEVSYSPRISTKDAIYSNVPKSASASYYDRDDDHNGYEPRSRPPVSRREPYRRGETVH